MALMGEAGMLNNLMIKFTTNGNIVK